jgi:hypothetical protein
LTRFDQVYSGASAEQREALRKLFTGPSFAGMGQSAELKELPGCWKAL